MLARMNTKFKLGDKVRVKTSAPRHGGKIGYVDCVGEGPANGTIILCTAKRFVDSDSKAVMFAAYCEDIELIKLD